MRIYDAIAVAAYPPILDIFITLAFVLFYSHGFGLLSPFSVFLISLVFVSIIPLSPFPYLYKKGYVDFNVSERQKRTLFYATAIVSYLIAALIFYYSNAFIMFYLVISYALIAIIIMAVNFSWKISTHSAGIAGPITALAYVFGWQYLILHVFTLVVVFSRLRLEVHTSMQVIFGAAVSIAITLAVFYAFMPF